MLFDKDQDLNRSGEATVLTLSEIQGKKLATWAVDVPHPSLFAVCQDAFYRIK